MHFKGLVYCALISIYWCDGHTQETERVQDDRDRLLREKIRAYSRQESSTGRSTYSLLSESIAQAAQTHANQQTETCSADLGCLTMVSSDRLGLEAIRQLHQQLDDDANGNVDLSESDDFLREELKYDSGYEKRQRAFHYNDDHHISVKELWDAWLRSEVHNWTIEQTSEWLAINVELPQYVGTFIQNRVSGATLPRLAVNNLHYLNNVLGIKDPIHKQKIALKAMDVVLFGPPKDGNPSWKDFVLVTLIIGAIIGCWYAYFQHKRSRGDLHRMMKDMESLHKAEIALEDLQRELERAKLAQENVATEKQNLEKRLQESAAVSASLTTSYSDLEVTQLKAEVEMLRMELQKAEGELNDRCWSPPPGLQQWLQLTHEIENKGYIKKKVAAEKQLQAAREACEKLRKKRSSLVGAFVSTHGRSIDDVDRSIVEARTSLNEVTQELQERVNRWKQIEFLCGFNVINNNGLQSLESLLYRNGNLSRSAMKGRISNSQDDLDDDTSSIYTASASGGGYVDSGFANWKEADSSGSETSKQEDDLPFDSVSSRSQTTSVNFMVGGEIANLGGSISEEQQQHSVKEIASAAAPPKPYNRTASERRSPSTPPASLSSFMTRSVSQDINPTSPPLDVSALNKSSVSDPTLEQTTAASKSSSSSRSFKSKNLFKEQPSVCATVEEDLYSTDSSTMDDESKRKKKKICFPGFSKKNKSKTND